MNIHRGMFFFLLTFFVFAGASAVSATHFAIEYDSPINFTTKADAAVNISIQVLFNLTNRSALDDALNNDYRNVTNLSAQLIMPNGTEVLVATNVNGSVFPDGAFDRGVTYVLNLTFNVDITIIPVEQEGDIVINITADVFNASNTSDAADFNESVTFLGLSFNWDASAPDVTIKFLDRTDTEKTTFQATDLVKIVCARKAAGASFNHTNITIQTAGGGSFDPIGTDEARDTAEKEFTVEFTDTRELGDYTVACYSVDDLGLVNDTVNTTFTIVKKPPKSTSAFANKEFKKPEGQKIVSETEDLGVLSAKGDSRQLRKGAVLKIDVKGESHSITLKALSPTEVTLTIASTPQDITIKKGETQDVDVDQDGQNDLAITFHQQVKTGARATADITIKAVSTPAAPKKDTSREPTPRPEEKGIKGSFAGSAVVTVIVIIAIIVIGFALIRGKKK